VSNSQLRAAWTTPATMPRTAAPARARRSRRVSRCLVVIRSATCRKPSEVRTIGAARHPDDVPAPLRQGGVSCRCASGEPHESPALTLTEGGRTKTITLAAAEVREVEAAPARYQAARTELDAQAEADLARLQGRHRGGADTAGRCR
jgi:hypothetical protein